MGEHVARTAAWESTKKTDRILLTSEDDRCIAVSLIALIYASKFAACFPTATLPTTRRAAETSTRRPLVKVSYFVLSPIC